MSDEVNIIIPSDPVAQAEIKKVIEDISNQWTIIEGYRNIVKEAVDGLSEKHEIPKKFINKLARTFHQRNFNTQKQEMIDFEFLYEKVIGDE